MIKKYLQIIIMLMITVSASAQIPEKPKSMLSPNAASLGEYGEVPVSPFTGIPQIEIPLYEIKVGDFKMPITMSYHAGGVRPDQHPGWTGLGWTLNAGGCISRIVNDLPDETYLEATIGIRQKGLYYTYGYLDFDWENKAELRNQLSEIGMYALPYKIDTEPDKFSFNFGGYSGSFYLDEKRQWKVQCEKSITIIFNSENGFTTLFSDKNKMSKEVLQNTDVSSMGRSHSFRKFTIITEDGTKYIFGDDESAIEFSVGFFSQFTNGLMANTWNLSKIIYPDNKQIIFTYEHGDYIAQMYFSLYSRQTMTDSATWPSGINRNDGYEGELILPSYLKKIEYLNNKIEFERSISNEKEYDFNRILLYKQNSVNAYDAFLPILQNYSNYAPKEKNYPNCLEGLKWHKLTSIKIRNSISCVKTIDLKYNDNINERLVLKSISEKDNITQSNDRKYLFEYYTPNLLPEYVLKQTDHWGFYNGKDPNFDNFYASRESNTSLSLHGTLSKITYPTGGYSRFVYEPHDYMTIMGNDRKTIYYSFEYNIKVGGLRIKNIINSATGNSNDEYYYKSYYYVSNFMSTSPPKSSGILNRLIQYEFKDYKLKVIDNPGKLIINVFSSQSILPVCNNSVGSHVNYNEVIEENADGTFSQFNYTNYATGNLDSDCDLSLQDELTPYDLYSSRSQERGLLYKTREYTKNRILQKETITDFEKDSYNYIRAMKINSVSLPGGFYGHYLEGAAYRFYTYSMRKIKETETIFENGSNPMQNILTYAYNENKLLKETTKTINNDEILKVSYKYPDSYISYPSLNSACWDMYKAHRLSPIIESKSEIIKNGVSHVIGQTRYNYKSIYRPDSVEQAVGNNPYELRSKYKYDAKWNPIYIENDLTDKTVYVWGYNYQYLVAEVKNATLGEVESILGSINDFSSSQISNIDKLNKLRVLLPKALVTTYEYIPLVGLIKKIDTNGIHTFFEYDIMGRLILTKDSKGNVIDHYKYNYKQN